MSTPRNAPCPCGSGKKYKHCCWLKEVREPTLPSPAQEVLKRVQPDSYSSFEEIQQRIDEEMINQNHLPVADFHGFSAYQMNRIVTSPFESPRIATFSTDPGEIKAPVMFLFNLMAEALKEDGLKLTGHGNLPRTFCQEAHQKWCDQGYRDLRSIGKVMKEADFPQLEIMRNCANGAALIYKRNGRFLLTRKVKELLRQNDHGEIYLELMKAHTQQYNWAYEDALPEFRIVQESFLFTLFLLQKYGSELRENRFYSKEFIIAFPAILFEANQGSSEPERDVAFCYQVRALERFARYFGLIEIQHNTATFDLELSFISKTELLDRLVAFHL